MTEVGEFLRSLRRSWRNLLWECDFTMAKLQVAIARTMAKDAADTLRRLEERHDHEYQDRTE